MKLLLLFVVYHPSEAEVSRLLGCLASLAPDVAYGVVINDYWSGEPAEQLIPGASLALRFAANLGYGRAINRAVEALEQLPIKPDWIGALNTDLHWEPHTFTKLLHWLEFHHEVVLAVPQITDALGSPESLCKRNPSILALLSRRFWPERFKPAWLKRYDHHYTMQDFDHSTVFDVPYLSGCCMLINAQAFRRIGGFDERFFLYLEDADLTRQLSALGRCVHLPIQSVVHGWGRGSHRSFRLMLVTLHSAWIYFRKWGFRLW